LVTLPLPLPLVFGADSLERFRAAAAASGLAMQVVEDQRLALDIDRPADFDQLTTTGPNGLIPGAKTRALLARLASVPVRHTA
jgi:2-phospho-L-lactate guanylyltransferase (CobY/MobA/RfbA family)